MQASILQEMEESEAQRLQRVASLEAELQTMKTTLEAKEEEIASLQEQVDSKVGFLMISCYALVIFFQDYSRI